MFNTGILSHSGCRKIGVLFQLLISFIGISSAAFAQATTTSLSVSPINESNLSQQVTLTATVTPSTATGQVTFYSDVKVVGTAQLSGGIATLNTNSLSSGNTQFRAYYLGDGSYNSSRSSSVTHKVNAGVGLNFVPGVTMATGAQPLRYTLVDINNDGIPDSIVPIASGHTLEIRIGNGDGTFQNPVPFPHAFIFPCEVVVMDLNQDGIQDLIVLDKGVTENIIVFHGTGGGQFTYNQQIQGDEESEGAEVADFNEDGYPDVAIGNSNGNVPINQIQIFWGNGTNLNPVPTIVPVFERSVSMVAADFNQDGHVDIAAASLLGNQISIIHGNGNGTFQPYVSIPSPPFTFYLTSADFNQDGYPDIATANLYSDSISVFLNNAGSGFAGDSGFPVVGSPYTIVSGDINGDGNTDIIFSTVLTNTIDVYLGDGMGGFQKRGASIIGNGAIIELADLNGDHISDIFMVHTGDDQIGVLLGESIGNLTAISGTPQSTAVNTAFSTAMQVSVEDSHGSPAEGVAVRFTAPSSGASGTFAFSATVLTDGCGIATAPPFTANANGGTYSVVATVVGYSGSAVFSLTNTGGVVNNMVFTQQPSSAAAGSAISPAIVVQLQGGSGNNLFLPGVPVTLTLTSGNGVLSGTTTVSTNASGAAVFGDLSIDLTGVKGLTASASGLSSVVSSLFNIVTPGNGTLTAYAGKDQSTHPGTPFPLPLQVRFQDIFGLPVAGTAVTFTVPASGPRGVFTHSSVVWTDANGIATAPELIANHTPGAFEVRATVAGMSIPAIFRLTVLDVLPGSPQVRGLVNAASFFRVISADSLITLFGDNFSSMPIEAKEFPLPTELGGISVTVDGYPAPLLFVNQNQINFQLPDVAELTERPDLASVVIVVKRNGVGSYSVVFPLRKTSPGIFLKPETLHAAARNQDFSLNSASNPVAPGEVILLYATGLGEVNPRVVTGDAAPMEPLSWGTEEVSAFVGNQSAKVLFSGLAPGFAGLFQVNVEVPENLHEGEHTVSIRVGGLVSNTAMISVGKPRK